MTVPRLPLHDHRFLILCQALWFNTVTFGASSPAPPLEVQVSTDRTEYRVNEPIRLQIRGNQDFYLWLFAISHTTGIVHQLFPNRLQPDNHFAGHRRHTVPARGLEFFADQTGTEEIVAVASVHPLTVDPDLFSSLGGFHDRFKLYIESDRRAILWRPLPRHTITGSQSSEITLKRWVLRIVP